MRNEDDICRASPRNWGGRGMLEQETWREYRGIGRFTHQSQAGRDSMFKMHARIHRPAWWFTGIAAMCGAYGFETGDPCAERVDMPIIQGGRFSVFCQTEGGPDTCNALNDAVHQRYNASRERMGWVQSKATTPSRQSYPISRK